LYISRLLQRYQRSGSWFKAKVSKKSTNITGVNVLDEDEEEKEQEFRFRTPRNISKK
jgi:hypothetical protein